MSSQGRDRRQRNLALLVAGTFFMENLDGTILTTAIPRIAHSLGVPSVAAGVTITAYLLTLAILIPLSGWMTQRFGVRRVFLTAIAVFTIASILCASSSTLGELTAARVLQGVGGAMMVPVGRLTVLKVTNKSDLIRAIALLTWPALAAPVIAPLAGGIITTYAPWEWIFLINVPLGVIAFLAAKRLVPIEALNKAPQLDWLGFLVSCTGIGALVYLSSLLSEVRPNQLLVAVLAVVGSTLLIFSMVHFLRSQHPLLDLRTMRIDTFRLSHAGGSVFRLTISAVPFLLPLLFQDGFGWSPVASGMLLLFLFVGNIAIKPATTWLLTRFTFRAVLIASTLSAAASMTLSAFLSDETPFPLIIALMLLSGMSRSVGFTAYNTIAFADVSANAMTAANTLSSTVQQLAAGLGIALGAVALRFGEVTSAAINETSTTGAFRFAFLVLAALTLVSTLETLRLRRTAGDNIRSARPLTGR